MTQELLAAAVKAGQSGDYDQALRLLDRINQGDVPNPYIEYLYSMYIPLANDENSRVWKDVGQKLEGVLAFDEDNIPCLIELAVHRSIEDEDEARAERLFKRAMLTAVERIQECLEGLPDFLVDRPVRTEAMERHVQALKAEIESWPTSPPAEE